MVDTSANKLLSRTLTLRCVSRATPNSEAILPDSFSSFSPHIRSGKGVALWLVVAFLLSAERLFLIVSNRLGRSLL